MFRNPRENAAPQQAAAVLPSTGRPPTPPSDDATKQSPYFVPASSMLPKSSPITVIPLPVIGRQSNTKVNSGKKNGSRPNQSILSFFGKADRTASATIAAEESGLFFEDSSPAKALIASQSPVSLRRDEGLRYNEDTTPVKRRRVDISDDDRLMRTPSPELEHAVGSSYNEAHVAEASVAKKKQQKHRGGFVADSSDEEEDAVVNNENITGIEPPTRLDNNDDDYTTTGAEGHLTPMEDETNEKVLVEVVETTKVPLKPPGDELQFDTSDRRHQQTVDEVIPTLSREATSMVAPGEFGEDDEFEDEEFFEEGEEFLERRWMEEQRAMEVAFDEDSKSESGTDGPRTPLSNMTDDGFEAMLPVESVALCPICDGSMKGLSETEASAHVNACLDGNAPPLKKEEASVISATMKLAESPTPQISGMKRYQRAGVARPAQANPFALMTGSKSKGSAFNRLMSGHAEDAAWAEAAANEQQSRGKPAYQRTCPFYKIMPGLYICVDAFRYGKVEGQNAYFLSHFHSDHYIGLTSTWCHGPIYASKVSCNLMRQQLRVDPKWLHPLEFDKKFEIPDTNGVSVTMIPANHCPGSSLYLFEKAVGKNKDGTPKLNRILHCGDFRACPAHIKHPLLCPDVLDSISGQTKQQVIDTCYLDTTYLTPKYAFPCQSDVIDACAQMCVSLSKEIPDDNDSWEKVKMAKAGSVMTKFLEEGKSEVIKPEEEDMEDKKPKMRGRLLVVIGTYSIGKERICMGIARALKSKIFAPPAKMRICKALEDDELNALLTSNPLEAQVHMQTLMEIRAETLHDYLITFKGHFHRVVGFRPTGWTYRPPTSRFTDNPAVNTVLYSEGWKSRFTMKDLAPQRGSTKESNCFGVPYSEHSSFRELTMFCCALRINRVIPTVNVGSAKSRERMKGWIEKWDAEKKKAGLFKVEVGNEGWGSGDGKLRYGV